MTPRKAAGASRKAVARARDGCAEGRAGPPECVGTGRDVRIARPTLLAAAVRAAYGASESSIRDGSRHPVAPGTGAPALPARGRSRSVRAADFLAPDTLGSENSGSPC